MIKSPVTGPERCGKGAVLDFLKKLPMDCPLSMLVHGTKCGF